MTKTAEPSFILVVDPSLEHVHECVKTLKGAGWNAVGTTDPWEAILLVSQLSLDLIILDLNRNGTGEADLCTLLAQDPGLKKVPAIFYSGERSEPTLPRDSDLCLRRPLNATALVATVRRLLGRPFPSEEVVSCAEGRDSQTRFVQRRRAPQALHPA